MIPAGASAVRNIKNVIMNLTGSWPHTGSADARSRPGIWSRLHTRWRRSVKARKSMWRCWIMWRSISKQVCPQKRLTGGSMTRPPGGMGFRPPWILKDFRKVSAPLLMIRCAMESLPRILFFRRGILSMWMCPRSWRATILIPPGCLLSAARPRKSRSWWRSQRSAWSWALSR